MALVGPNMNQLVVISPTGTELARFPTDMSGNNGSSVPFDEPSSVQFDGRRMIVTNDAFFSGDASHFVIFDVWAGEPGAPVFVPGRKPAGHRYRLTVRPRKTTAGDSRTFHFHATHGGSALRGALVSFGGTSARTGRHGNVTIVVGFERPGRKVATLTVRGRVVARTHVQVAPESQRG